MEKAKGFPFIKILIVVAVIALLVVVVFAVLVNFETGKADKRAMDVRIISALGQVSGVAEIVYMRDGKYDNICSDSASLGVTDGLDTFQTEITDNGGIVACYASGSDYCVSAQLNDGQFWHINSRGEDGRAMAACMSPFPAADPGEEDERETDVATHNRLLVCGQDQMIDNDGNRYDTVEIGGLCWMAENLKYLPSVSPSAKESEIDSIYYVYDYQGTDVVAARAHPNFQTYGVLYNWPAAMAACPPGTRLPTDAEQHSLDFAFATAGGCDPARFGWGCDPAGAALKAASPAWNGNNSSGFSALPAGFRSTDGSFQLLTAFAYFWSSFESGSSAWSRRLGSGTSAVNRWAGIKGDGLSVRCVR